MKTKTPINKITIEYTEEERMIVRFLKDDGLVCERSVENIHPGDTVTLTLDPEDE